ncbi:response regulator [Syntrophomonas wolfei]|jgi:DNA-binding NarL/FixJ family response regulator|uniref:Stage 0 sporulation protein A homolog n=1 Tax=Syntrophomonas wolfei subsp. wolfei (strain DSM 2245B / Goettingen) TaxID=335541 RepID=Q0B0G6_SYNWW|nr:response regulator transcription factor [Syntrophomonas wolfei]ABI67538.1 response regulator receiver protein [Syntrophomonas wolfei subsp. wolfei str. Goettingen G311]NLT20660.1 response regulator transcription factor [Syntrophomonadaceae bacterium]
MDKARVVIADDHVLVREGLRKLLELDSNIKVIDEVGDGQGAINIARKEKPDIIIMDVNMPGTDGIVATRVIKRELPSVRIIALTVYEGEEVVDMVKAGASAYILKDVAGSELVDTIHRVMNGEVVIYPRVANRLVRELRQSENRKSEIRLTKREKDVLTLLVKGNTNKEMAEVMFISEKTVKNHLTSIFRKLGVKDRTHAAIYALKNRIVSEE